MLTINPFIIFFYTTMVKNKTFISVELNTKQFSGEMVLVLLNMIVYNRNILSIIILYYKSLFYFFIK